MNVGEICNRQIPVVSGTTPVVAAAKSMDAFGQHILVVIEERAGKRVATGIVTDHDVAAVIARESDPRELALKDIMRAPPGFVAESDSAFDTLRWMRRNDLHDAVVHNEAGVLLGMITTDQLVECLAAEIEGMTPSSVLAGSSAQGIALH